MYMALSDIARNGLDTEVVLKLPTGISLDKFLALLIYLSAQEVAEFWGEEHVFARALGPPLGTIFLYQQQWITKIIFILTRFVWIRIYWVVKRSRNLKKKYFISSLLEFEIVRMYMDSERIALSFFHWHGIDSKFTRLWNCLSWLFIKI